MMLRICGVATIVTVALALGDAAGTFAAKAAAKGVKLGRDATAAEPRGKRKLVVNS